MAENEKRPSAALTEVTISTSEYERLLQDSSILTSMRRLCVADWEGYGDAMEDYALREALRIRRRAIAG